jgi:hypothetical protein
MARKPDPVIGSWDYAGEATQALLLALPDDLPGSRLIFVVIDRFLAAWLEREPLRQSHLDALYEAFDEAVEEMKAVPVP